MPEPPRSGWQSPPIRRASILLFFLLLLSLPRVVYAAGSDLSAAGRLYQREKFNDALAALDRYEKSSAPTAESLDLRGCILMEQQKFDDAQHAFDAAHQLDANFFAARLHSGDLLLRQKRFADARAIYQGLTKETNILMSYERLAFATLLTWLGEHNDTEARKTLEAIHFPTETGAYYYAQAAWAFAHGNTSDARDWLKQVSQLYPADARAWFARWLFDFGWIKDKPAPATLR